MHKDEEKEGFCEFALTMKAPVEREDCQLGRAGGVVVLMGIGGEGGVTMQLSISSWENGRPSLSLSMYLTT